MLIHSSPLKSRKRFTPDAFHTFALYFGLDDLTDTDCWAQDGSTCGHVFVTVSHQTRWKLSGGKSCLFLNKKEICSYQWCPWCLLTLVSLWERWGCILCYVSWCVLIKVCTVLQDWLSSPGHLPSEGEAGRIPDPSTCTVQSVLQLLQTLYAIMEQSSPSSYRNG